MIYSQEIRSLFTLKPSERLWHIPVLASIASAVPLLTGLYLDNLEYGKLACLGGLVMLYIPKANLETRMRNMILCSFGFILSFTLGICFSFNPIVSAIAFGVYTGGVHWVVRYFKMKPPGNFFFIMIASMASCLPFNLETIPERIGVLSLGLMFSVFLVMVYGLLRLKSDVAQHTASHTAEEDSSMKYVNIYESFILGVFMLLSLFFGLYLELSNPYWIPISCLAVMQGVGTHNVWRRGIQRVIGTLLGIGVSFILLPLLKEPLEICIGIFVLQFFIEIIVVRQYALAVILITPMTILLAEAGSQIHLNSTGDLIQLRLIHIIIGSLIGAIGGWFIYHEKLRFETNRQIRKTKVSLQKRRFY